MNTKELKKIIRTMVRECVNEILAEKYIERSINEMAGTKHRVVESVEASPALARQKQKAMPSIRREDLIKKYGLDEDSPMASIFEDSLQNNPMLNGEGDIKDPPGTVPERALEKSGIMSKDWSKYF